MVVERQELYCHDCEKYVQFDMDLELDGNYVLKCPNCGHEHCRIVEDGEITGIRWDSRNGIQTIYISNINTTSSTNSAWNTLLSGTGTSTGSVFLYNAWLNTGTGT